MGRLERISIILVSCLLIVAMGTLSAYGASVSENKVLIKNHLPEFVLYISPGEGINADFDQIEVLINDEKSNVEFAGKFKALDEGVSYFFLVDTANHISNVDFGLIKKIMLDLSGTFTAKDRIYLITYGENVRVVGVYDPTSDSFRHAVDKLSLDSSVSYFYNAIDIMSEEALIKDDDLPDRNVAAVFTDGIEDITNGYKTNQELLAQLQNTGTALFGFVVGDDVLKKDRLAMFCEGTNGFVKDAENLVVTEFRDFIDNTITIKAEVENIKSIGATFSVSVFCDGERIIYKSQVPAVRDEKNNINIKVPFLMTITVVTAIIVIVLYRRQNNIVFSDGKVIYKSKQQKQYYKQLEDYKEKCGENNEISKM